MAEGPFEIAMVQDGSGRSCTRPDEVRKIAGFVMAWRDAPKTCISCLFAQAVRMVNHEPLCAQCRDQREIRMGSDDLIATRQATRGDLKDGSTVGGYGIVFNSLSVDLGGFREVILPQAVNRALQEGADLLGLWNHNSDIPLARISAGTLRVTKDATGLRTEYVLPTSAVAQYEAVQLGNVKGQSFGFRALDDEWLMDGPLPTRFVKDMRVSETSLVSFPAYPSTTAKVMSRENRVEWLRKKHQTLMAR